MQLTESNCEIYNITLRGESGVINPKYFDFQTFLRFEDRCNIQINNSKISNLFIGKVTFDA